MPGGQAPITEPLRLFSTVGFPVSPDTTVQRRVGETADLPGPVTSTLHCVTVKRPASRSIFDNSSSLTFLPATSDFAYIRYSAISTCIITNETDIQSIQLDPTLYNF